MRPASRRWPSSGAASRPTASCCLPPIGRARREHSQIQSSPASTSPPLDQASAAEILDRAASVPDARIRGLILEVADGNPLALLELPRTMTAADDAIDADRLPLTRRLERSFAARIGDLDGTKRAALGLAALSDSGDPPRSSRRPS